MPGASSLRIREGGPSQLGAGPYGAAVDVLAREHRLQDVDRDAVGRYRHRDLRQTPGGVQRVECRPDPVAGLGQYGQPLLGQIASGDVDGGVRYAQDPALAVLQTEDGGRVDVLVQGIAGRSHVLLHADGRLPGGEHLLHHPLHRLRGEARPHLGGASARGLLDRGALHAFGRCVEPDEPQLRVEDVQAHGREREQRLEKGPLKLVRSVRSRGLGGRDHHVPARVRLTRPLGADGQPAPQQGAVAAPQHDLGLGARGGRRVLGEGRHGQQVGRRTPQHRLALVTEESLGLGAPADQRALPVDHDMGRVPRPGLAGRAAPAGDMACAHGDQPSLAQGASHASQCPPRRPSSTSERLCRTTAAACGQNKGKTAKLRWNTSSGSHAALRSPAPAPDDP